MNLSSKNHLKLSLAFNFVLTTAIIVIYSQSSKLKYQNRVNKVNTEILEYELRDAINQADRYRKRYNIQSARVLGFQEYASRQIQIADD